MDWGGSAVERRVGIPLATAQPATLERVVRIAPGRSHLHRPTALLVVVGGPRFEAVFGFAAGHLGDAGNPVEAAVDAFGPELVGPFAFDKLGCLPALIFDGDLAGGVDREDGWLGHSALRPDGSHDKDQRPRDPLHVEKVIAVHVERRREFLYLQNPGRRHP